MSLFNFNSRGHFYLAGRGHYYLALTLRIARYYETLAELALEVASASHAPLPHSSLESGKFLAQAETLLDTVDPATELGEDNTAALALHTLEEHYQSLKSRLLEAGAQGQLPVAEMDARLRIAGATRRAAQQAVKAALMLNEEKTAVPRAAEIAPS